MTEKNLFSDHYDRYIQTRLADRLKRKYTPLPYYLKYKMMRKLALVSSYVFNLFSGLTAAGLVFLFVYKLSQWLVLSVVLTLIFLSLLELSKRQVSTTFLKDWVSKVQLNIPMCFLALVLSALSISFSYFGSQRIVLQLASIPEIEIQDTLVTHLESKVQNLNQQIEAARNTRYRGTTTTSSQRTIELLTTQLTNLETEILHLQRKNRATMASTQLVHQQYTAEQAQYFALVTLAFEAFFFLSIWYLEYYDFRSYVEMNVLPIANITQSGKLKPNTKHTLKSSLNRKRTGRTMSNSNLSTQEEVKLLKSRIATARYRLKNGVGKRETAERNLEEYTGRLKGLQDS